MDGETRTAATVHDPVMRRFSQEVREVFGDRLERIVLFGSRARGDFRPDSDYDIALFLEEPFALGPDSKRAAAIGWSILDREGFVINALPLRAGSHREKTSFMDELRRDGIDL